MRKLLPLSLALFSLAASAQSQSAANSTVQLSANSGVIPVTVNCDKGESLNRTLSRLHKDVPATVSVKGMCTEYVQVIGFDNLTLNGLPGAALGQPSTSPGNLGTGVLLIGSSRSVTVNGLSVQGDTVAPIVIAHGSTDIRLENLNVQGGEFGIIIVERSQALLSHVVGQNAGYTPLGIYDASDVHIEHCLFDNPSGALWHAGMSVGASHVTMFDDTIRNMQVGIDGYDAIVDLTAYNSYTPSGGPSDVVIDSPDATNYWGVHLYSGSSLNLGSARLVMNQPGQPWSGSGGISISDGSTLNAGNASLEITNSHGQGIVIQNNSHATITGVTVKGSAHGGLVLANLSTLDVSPGAALTLVGGNAVDLFCDSGSIITGAANMAGVPTSQCAHVLAGEAAMP
jgi:hypothetical protein